jgi:Protein of unknown function (DUF2961)
MTPSISTSLALYFGAEYIGATGVGSFTSRLIGANAVTGNGGSGFYSYIPIPFATGIKIDIVNGSSAHSMQLYASAAYMTGVPNTWTNTRKLKVATGTVAACSVDSVQTLVNVTSQPPGRLAGVYLSVDSAPGSANPLTAPLEGNVKIYLDGAVSPTFESSGTEDYFNSSNYFAQVPTSNSTSPNSYNVVQSPYAGVTFLSASTWEAYRFHIPDPYVFANALKVTWNCGDSTEVNFTGTARLAYAVWYYTE